MKTYVVGTHYKHLVYFKNESSKLDYCKNYLCWYTEVPLINLMLSTLHKFLLAEDLLKYFSNLSRKRGFDHLHETSYTVFLDKPEEYHQFVVFWIRLESHKG